MLAMGSGYSPAQLSACLGLLAFVAARLSPFHVYTVREGHGRHFLALYQRHEHDFVTVHQECQRLGLLLSCCATHVLRHHASPASSMMLAAWFPPWVCGLS